MAADKGESTHRILQAIDSLLGHQKVQPVARSPDHGPQGAGRLGGPVSPGHGPGRRSTGPRRPRGRSAPCWRCGSPTTRRVPSSRRGAATPSSRTRAYGRRRSPARPRCRWRTASARPWRSAPPAVSRRPTTPTNNQVTAWAPQDYGQARMAALGWLISLAEQHGAGKGQEVIAAFRKAAEKKPPDVPALWDWFYLCEMRFDNAGAFAAARDLTRATPTDPLALWAYLYTLGGRQLGLGIRYYKYQGGDTGTRTPRRSRPRRGGSRARLLPGPPDPSPRAGPGAGPPEHLPGAEAGQTHRGRGAVLSRSRRQLAQFARSPAPSAWPPGAATPRASASSSTATSGSRRAQKSSTYYTGGLLLRRTRPGPGRGHEPTAPAGRHTTTS